MTTSHDHGVRLADAMSANALVSGVSGLVLTAAAAPLGRLLGAAPLVLATIGLGLLGFAGLLLRGLATPALLRPTGRTAVAGDLGWVVATAAVVMADVLTPVGERTAIAVAVVVGAFAVAQASGLRRARGAPRPGVRRVAFTAASTTDAPPDQAWAAVADAGGYAAFAPGLAATEVDGDLAVGMGRTCTDERGATWHEQATLVEPNRRYRIEVDVTSYPWLLRHLLDDFGMRWEVEPDGTGSRLRLTFSGGVRLGLLGRLAMWAGMRRDPVGTIVARYVSHLDQRVAA